MHPSELMAEQRMVAFDRSSVSDPRSPGAPKEFSQSADGYRSTTAGHIRMSFRAALAQNSTPNRAMGVSMMLMPWFLFVLGISPHAAFPVQS